MRANAMIWMQRLVFAVFLAGFAALVAAVVLLVSRAEGLPPMPFLAGIMGAAALILLAGACLAMISVAVSAKRAAEALQRMARLGGSVPAPGNAEVEGKAQDGSKLTTDEQSEPRTTPHRPQGKRLVATR